jgi:hypothetical protein
MAELYTSTWSTILQIPITFQLSHGLPMVICTAVCPQPQADLPDERPAIAGTIDFVLANNCLTNKLMLYGAIIAKFHPKDSASVIFADSGVVHLLMRT